MTLSLISPMPVETACTAPESNLLDVRLHAPTPDTMIVWVAGAVDPASAPLLTLRVRQQFQRASHVILDLSSVTRLDPPVAADLHTLEAHAERCGTRLHIAGAENPAIAEPLRHLDSAQRFPACADAILAILATRAAGPSPMKEAH
jgi:MFS superfamily sulfate permease-like transporter